MRKQVHNIYGDQSAQRRRFSPLVPIGVLTSIVLALIAGTVFVLPHRNTQAIPFLPYLERQEVITDQCATGNEGCGWSNHKPRVVRTSDDTVYVVYVSEGSSGAFNDKVWHLMKRNADGTWQEIGSGAAGSEPSTLLRTPNDDLWVAAYPQNASLQVTHFARQSNGSYTSSAQTIPGFGTTPTDATYFSAGTNSQGDMVVTQDGWNVPGDFTNPRFNTDIYYTYYDHTTGQWSPIMDNRQDYRYGYLFTLLGNNHDLAFAGDLDDQRSKFPGLPQSGSWAVVNGVDYFSTSAISTQNLTKYPVSNEFNSTMSDFIITMSDDVYVDTQGRTHVLYMDIIKGGQWHAIIQNGQIIKDVPVPNSNYWWGRIIQDTTGRFYIISMNGGYLTVYPGAAGDTDGTQLDPVVNIPLTYPYCYCQAPHLTVPRGGTPLADYVDGFYEAGSGEKLVYFRLRLNGSTSGGSTPTVPAQATPTSAPTPTPQPGVPTPTPTPTPPPSIRPPTSYTVYQSGLAAGWSQFTYQGSANLANTNPVLAGDHSIAWTANAWGTFALGNPQTLDITPYGYLHFALQAGQANSHYAVQLVDTKGKGLSSYLLLANYGGDPQAGQWKTYDIPLTALKADGQQIQAIGVQNYSGNGNQRLYIDDVKFVATVSTSTSTSSPTVTPTSDPPSTATATPLPPAQVTPPSDPPSTTTRTPIPSQTYSIYNGGLAPGWKQGVYQSSVNLTNPTPSFDGNPSIAWTANSGWATCVLSNSSLVDTTPYGYLHFALQAGQANEHYAVQLYDASGRGLSSYVLLSDYGGDPVSGQWKVYNIPLAALGAVGKQINGLTFQNFTSNAHQVLYLDDISFQ